MASKMKRSISDDSAERIKKNLVKNFSGKIPTGNITREKIDGLATSMMASIEKDNGNLVGTQKRDIVFDAFNELLSMIREISGIKASELEVVDFYYKNQELFDSLAYAFKVGFKKIVEMVTQKKGFGCCSG